MEQIEFKSQIDPEDYRNFNLWHFFVVSTKGWRGFIPYILGFLSLPLWVYFYFRTGSVIFYLLTMFFFTIFFLSFVVFPLTLWFSSKKHYKGDKFLQEEQTVYMNNESIVLSTPSSNLKVDWKDLFIISENKNYFFLYISNFKAILIPKRYINTNINEFINNKAKEYNLKSFR